MTQGDITDIFITYDLERLEVYKNRKGNPNHIEIKTFGDTICTKFPEVGYFNHVHNFDEHSIQNFDQIKAFYRSDHLKFKVTIHQAGNSDILNRWVEDNGGLMVNRHGILGIHLSELCDVKYGELDYKAEKVSDSNVREFVESYISGFEADMNKFENIYANMRLITTIHDLHLYIVRKKSEAVGVAVLYCKKNIAYLAGGATKEEVRNKGAHTYSIRFRIIEAIKRGSEFIASWAPIHSDSYDNMRREGLEHLYTNHVYLMDSIERNK